MASDYDKLKEMYRLQGQEEQGRRFREMTGPKPDQDEFLQGTRERAFSNPNEPMAGLEPIPAMQRAVDADKARIMSAAQREADAFETADDLKDMFLDRYGAHASSLMDLEARGMVTLSPKMKDAAARVVSAMKQSATATRKGRQAEWESASPVLRQKPGGGYEEDRTAYGEPYRIGLGVSRDPYSGVAQPYLDEAVGYRKLYK